VGSVDKQEQAGTTAATADPPIEHDLPATPETSTISACTKLHPDRIVARFRQVAVL
jgi:hypothetical protein